MYKQIMDINYMEKVDVRSYINSVWKQSYTVYKFASFKAGVLATTNINWTLA